MTYLARSHEFRQGAPGILHRNARIDPVLVVEIDHVDAQARQTGVTGLAHVVRVPVDAQPGAVFAALVAELGGEHDVVAS